MINFDDKTSSINFFLRENLDSIVIEAFANNTKISSYRFISSKIPHPIGKEIVKATLISWATIDLCFASKININFEVYDIVAKYIDANYSLCSLTYSYIYSKKIAKLNILNTKKHIQKHNFKLNGNHFFLGKTGGRDSTLCKILLEVSNKKIYYYKVSYDDDLHSPDAHVDMVIHNKETYNQVSVSGAKIQSNIISTHQADDIHVTFAAPYFDLKTNMPANLAIGLPWEVIHNLEDGCTDLVPTESYSSIKILIDLFIDFNLKEFKIISPIATLHSLGVYKLLGKIIGKENLLKLDSCWNSSYFSGKACGSCPKCQRLKFIFKMLYNEEYLKWCPSLDIKNADFLFGSLYGYNIIHNPPKKNWHLHSLIDKCSSIFSKDFRSLLKERYKVKEIEMDNFSVKYNSIENQTWEDIINQIIRLIKINYNTLSDTIKNTENLPYLPFEKEYKWCRQNKILNCYSGFKLYRKSTNKWIEIRFSEDKEILSFPDLPVFRKWLDEEILTHNFPNVLNYYEKNC